MKVRAEHYVVGPGRRIQVVHSNLMYIFNTSCFALLQYKITENA